MSRLLSKYNPDKVQLFLLGVLAILIPSGLYRFEGILIALLFVNGFIFLKGYKKIKDLSKESTFLILFFLIYIIGLLYTENLRQQYSAMTQHASLILLPLAFLGCNLAESNIEKIKKVFIWSTVFFISVAFLYAMYSTILTGKSTIYVHESVQSKFSYYGLTRVFRNWHPTYVSLFANLSIVFGYYVYVRKKQYILATVVFIVCIVSIFFLNSFIGIIALGLILFIWILCFFKEAWKKFIIVMLFCGLAFSFFHFNPLSYSKIDQLKETGLKVTDKKEERNILNLRIVKWESSMYLFRTEPFFGVTPGDFKDRMVEYYKENGFEYAAKERFSSHNQYLFILGSFGLIGFLIFVITIIYPFRFGAEMRMFLILFSIFCLTEDILERQQGLVLFVFMYMILSQNKEKNHLES